MPNVMAALPNIGGALCSTPQFGWRPLLECRAVTLPKTRNSLKLPGVPQTNETISAASGPKFTILCGHVEEILLLNKFFPIVNTCLSCANIARQSCGMVPRWRFLFIGKLYEVGKAFIELEILSDSLRNVWYCILSTSYLCDVNVLMCVMLFSLWTKCLLLLLVITICLKAVSLSGHCSAHCFWHCLYMSRLCAFSYICCFFDAVLLHIE